MAALASAEPDSKLDVKVPDLTRSVQDGKTFTWENKTDKRQVLATAEQVHALTVELSAHPTAFGKIKLSGHSLSPEAAKAMAAILTKTTNVTVVDLSDIGATCFEADVVSVLTSLTTALAGNKSLTEFNVSDNALGLSGVSACAALLSAKGSARWEALKFNNTGLGPDAAKLIAESVLKRDGKPTALRTLEVHQNCLGNEGAIALAPLIAASPLLENLGFTATRIGEKGGAAVVKALCEAKSRNFVSLVLSDSAIGEDSAKLLVRDWLFDQPHLKLLDLSDTDFGDAIDSALDVLCGTATELSVLKLNYLDMPASLAVQLAKLIKLKPLLSILELKANYFRDTGAEIIAEALKECKNLTHLKMTQCLVSAKLDVVILEALKGKDMKYIQLDSHSLSPSEKDIPSAESEDSPDQFPEDDDDDDDEDEEDIVDDIAKLSIKN